jgi:hypothetical protein
MIPLNLRDLQIAIAVVVFLLGFVCVVIGIVILVTRGYSREVRALARQTAKLGEKGVGQEVTGLVSSASELVGAINGLVRTASGVAVFLVLLGIAMLGSAYWIITQIEWAVL